MQHSVFVTHTIESSPGMVSAIGLHRSFGKTAFSRRELRLAHIVLSEVRWLHDAGVPGEDGRAAARLAPRLQTVLSLLVDGQSAKQVAFNLGLSTHTVRGYVKDIYRHFDVSSRAELMRRFMVGDGHDR